MKNQIFIAFSMYMIDRNLFAGKKIAILGFGLEGKSTLNFLLNQHFAFEEITVLDMHPQTLSVS